MTETPVFQHHRPKPPLSEFIELFWHHDGPPPSPPLKERVLPMGSVEFVIRLSRDKTRVYDSLDSSLFQEYPGSIVTGPQSKFFVLDKSEQDQLIGIHFRPGGAFPFFGMPLTELHNRHLRLDELWAGRADGLRSELLEAESVARRFQILENHLLRAMSPTSLHPAVSFALKQFNSAHFSRTVSRVAGQANLSQRRFIQVFSEQVGLTPKLFSRVRRFQRTVSLTGPVGKPDWSEVALSCGYFDQAHFIRDFQEFSGLTPTRYLTLRTEQASHVPIGGRIEK